MSLEQKIETITQEIAVTERSGTLEELSKALFEKKRLQKELDLTPTSYDRFVIKQLLDPVVAEHPVWDSFFGARLKNTLIAWGSATQVVEVVKLHIGHWAIVIDSPKGELACQLNTFCNFSDSDKIVKRNGHRVRYFTIIRAEPSEQEKETGIRLSDDWWHEATSDQAIIDVWIGKHRLANQTEEQLEKTKGSSPMLVFRVKNGDFVSIDMSRVTQVKRNINVDYPTTVIFDCDSRDIYAYDLVDVFAAQQLVTDAIEFQAKLGLVGFVSKNTDIDDTFLDGLLTRWSPIEK